MANEFTAFGKEVKHRLIDTGHTQEWLIEKVRERTGKYMDNSYMYKILTGQESGASFLPAIREALEMNETA